LVRPAGRFGRGDHGAVAFSCEDVDEEGVHADPVVVARVHCWRRSLGAGTSSSMECARLLSLSSGVR
jgi:hypothetical protein